MKGNYEIKDLDNVVQSPNFIAGLISKLMSLSQLSNQVVFLLPNILIFL